MQTLTHVGMAAASLCTPLLVSVSMNANFLASFAAFFATFLTSLLYREAVQSRAARGLRGYVDTLLKGAYVAVNDRALRLLILITIAGAFPQTVFVLSWQPIVASGLGTQLLGPVFLIFQLSAALGGLIASRTAKRCRAAQCFVKIVIASLIIRSLAYIAIAAAGWNAAAYIGMVILWELMFGLARPYTIMVYNQFIPSEYRATILSLLSSIGQGSFGVANIAVSTLFGITGFYLPYLYTSTIYLIMAAAFRRIVRYLDKT